MRRSTDRILTTHAGSLPRPRDLYALSQAKPFDPPAYNARLRAAVHDVVHEQASHGLDVIDDGELSKPNFVSYINERLGGFEMGKGGATPAPIMRDHKCFPDYYSSSRAAYQAGAEPGGFLYQMYPPLVCTAPLTYVGQALQQRDLDNLKAALVGVDYQDTFVPAISPENAQYAKSNAYYKTEEEFSFALADALREEYRMIVEAGFLVQIDDPQLITYYNRNPDKSVAECRKWAEGRIEVLNHSLRGIPEEKIRFHTCYSFDMAPRLGDMELKDILDIILRINAGGYSFEGGNPRHEHEWQLWKTTKLPDGKILIPGVVGISSLVVEHPDLVAERIVRYANLVGRENVIAGIDCGFGTVAGVEDIHSSIAWAKIDALVEGARRATEQLW